MNRDELLAIGLSEEMADSVSAVFEREMAEITAQKDEINTAYNQLRVDSAVENALLVAKAKNIKAVKALVDNNAVSFDENGKAVGINEQINALKENRETAFLFDTGQVEVKGAGIAGQARDNSLEPDVDNMNYSQLCAYLEANPQAQL